MRIRIISFFWRGGYSFKTSSITGTFTTEAVTNVSSEHVGLSRNITVSTTNNLSVGQFVYATYSGNDYYIGTVKSITGSVVELEMNGGYVAEELKKESEMNGGYVAEELKKSQK